MKVVWTETAVKHLTAIVSMWRRPLPCMLNFLVRRLWDRTGQLAAFPKSGRPVPESHHVDIRELFERPYRIIYQALPERVEVPAIVHARRGPEGMEEAGAGRAASQAPGGDAAYDQRNEYFFLHLARLRRDSLGGSTCFEGLQGCCAPRFCSTLGC